MKIVSGIQPTGKIHIGGYLGAIRQWTTLQKENECIFFIADLHALTVPRSPQTLQKEILNLATELISAGIDPKKSTLFIQSQVKEHAELAWILSTLCPLGELKRMTQFKEKSRLLNQNVNAGLLNYPILQAADILLYKADAVPVGKDQIQHIELTREIAKKFNKRFGKIFTIPKPLLIKEGQKIKSLTNPLQKMSKSQPQGCLYLSDTPEIIKAKIMKAVTDPGKEIKYNPEKKPGISNLLTIFSLFSGKTIKEIEKEFEGKGYAQFKKSLAKLLIDSLSGFQQNKKDLLQREDYVKKVLAEGRKKAQAQADSTIKEVRRKIGLI